MATRKNAFNRKKASERSDGLVCVMPVRFAYSIFEYASQFIECANITLSPLSSKFLICTMGAASASLVKISLNLNAGNDFYSELTRVPSSQSGLLDYNIGVSLLVWKKKIKSCSAGCTKARIHFERTNDFSLIETGTGAQIVNAPKRAAKAPTGKGGAPVPAPRSVEQFSVRHEVCIGNKEVVSSIYDGISPPDEIVFRVDAAYLAKDTASHGGDCNAVEIWFDGEMVEDEPIAVGAGAAAPSSETDGLLERLRREKEKLAAQPKQQPPAAAAAAKKTRHFVPRRICLSYVPSAGDSDTITTFLDVVDRRTEYENNLSNALSGMHIETDEQIDAGSWRTGRGISSLEAASEADLGFDQVAATQAELLVFPRNLTRAPEPSAYSPSWITQLAKGAVFAKRARIHRTVDPTTPLAVVYVLAKGAGDITSFVAPKIVEDPDAPVERRKGKKKKSGDDDDNDEEGDDEDEDAVMGEKERDTIEEIGF